MHGKPTNQRKKPLLSLCQLSFCGKQIADTVLNSDFKGKKFFENIHHGSGSFGCCKTLLFMFIVPRLRNIKLNVLLTKMQTCS